jgi:hypothetical protein
MEPILTNFSNSTGKSYISGTSLENQWIDWNSYIHTINPCKEIPLDTPYFSSTLTISNNNIMQNKVAVFKVTRDDNQKITSSKFIKELWIESKNGSSIDFEVAKDPEISKYEANEIVIKSIYTVTL